VLILPWELVVVVVNVKLFPIGNISNSLTIYYKIILDGCAINTSDNKGRYVFEGPSTSACKIHPLIHTREILSSQG
jgi:hypothetical protein